jgi:hypothetical protein
MIRTSKMDPNHLAESLEHLRAQNAPDDVIAGVSAALDDLEVSVGHTPEEFEELRAKVTESGGRFVMLHSSAMHSKIDL